MESGSASCVRSTMSKSSESRTHHHVSRLDELIESDNYIVKLKARKPSKKECVMNGCVKAHKRNDLKKCPVFLKKSPHDRLK